MWKRILTTVLFLLVLGVGKAQAQSDYGYEITDEEFAAYTEAVKTCESPSLECLVKNTTRFVAMEWVNDIVGNGGVKKTIQLEDNVTTDASIGNGVIGGMTRAMVSMYSYRPANTGRYVADVSRSAGIQPAQAQGLGFAALDPVLELWKKFRNIAYFFFIIIFVVIGFMIMFRQKIGGQAAITAQQAIPSIIVSLILVTFSYAISGFLIDMMYLSMFLIVGMFSNLTGTGGIAENLISMNIFQLGGNLLGAIWGNFKGGDVKNLISVLIESMSGVNNGVTDFISTLSGLTMAVVLAIAVVIAIFRLFFELLKSYASIVVGVVTAPLYLMTGAIPGTNPFSGWIKNMIGNLAAFPTVLLVVVLFYEFTKANDGISSGGFMPPFLVGSGSSAVAGPLLGFALLLALPEIVKKIKDALGAKDGIGGEIAGWAGESMKKGWGAKYGAKAMMKQGAMLPVRAGGAYAGREVGRRVAKGMGLSDEAQSRWGKIGAATGFAATPAVLSQAKGIAKFGVRQAGGAGFSATRDYLGEMVADRRKFSRDELMDAIANKWLGAQSYKPAAPGTPKVDDSISTADHPEIKPASGPL